MANNTTKTGRIEYVDTLKCFAIFCVLWGHAMQYLKGSYDFFHNPMFEFIYSFHMPLFFIVSGLFFKSSLKLNFKDFTLKKGLQLLLPCIVWATIGVIIRFSMNLANGNAHFYIGKPRNTETKAIGVICLRNGAGQRQTAAGIGKCLFSRIEGASNNRVNWELFFNVFPDYHNIFEKVVVDGCKVIMQGYSVCSDRQLNNVRAIWLAEIRENKVSLWQIYPDTEENRKTYNIQ
jgi:fucose 4-O-acetylase-like acetyltransferase